MSKRVLIVDDDSTVLVSYKKLIAGLFTVVDVAESREQAERLLETHRYDALIVDLMLSNRRDTEGLDLVKWVKDYMPSTRTIMITGHGTPEVMQQARELGLDHYLEKPVTIDVVKKILLGMGIE